MKNAIKDCLWKKKAFSCHSIPGKVAVFKAIVVGTPTPTVTWSRANGEIHFNPDMCQQKYDEASHEHTLQVSFTCSSLSLINDKGIVTLSFPFTKLTCTLSPQKDTMSRF